MSTALSFSQTDPVSIPSNSNNDDDEKAYKDMIKQLAAQAPEPYGAIPPLTRRKDKDKSKRKKTKKKKKRDSKDKKTPIRRMSHVENWLAVDSKESIPDEEDLVRHQPCFFLDSWLGEERMRHLIDSILHIETFIPVS